MLDTIWRKITGRTLQVTISEQATAGYLLVDVTLAGVDEFRLEVRRDGEHVGNLWYRTCALDGFGEIAKISLYEPVAGTGLARHLVTGLRARYPDVTWWTTAHTGPEATSFWARMSQDYGDPYVDPRRDICSHPVTGAPWTGPLDFPTAQ